MLTTPDEAEAASVLVGMQFASYDSAAGTPHSLGVGISSLPVEPYPSYVKLKLENLLLRNENMKLTSVKKCTEKNTSALTMLRIMTQSVNFTPVCVGGSSYACGIFWGLLRTN